MQWFLLPLLVLSVWSMAMTVMYFLFTVKSHQPSQASGGAFEKNGGVDVDLRETFSNHSKNVMVQRIYYINLAKNTKRRFQMEHWLSKQSIPYERVNATVGFDDPSACVDYKREPEGQCRGISGLILTNLDIIRNYNTSGLTLVFEDDYIPKSPHALNELVESSLKFLPVDWDIVRWDCRMPYGSRSRFPSNYKFIFNDQSKEVFRTTATIAPEWFCGGTHFMLWKGDSVRKLEGLWSEQPYDTNDCRLSTDELNSYCINFEPPSGQHFYPQGEVTDIPKRS